MFTDKESFLSEFDVTTRQLYGKSAAACGHREKYTALARMTADSAVQLRASTIARRAKTDGRRIYYFSMEFLIGRLLKSYLMDLGCKDAVEAGLRELGEDPEDIYACERDPGLGNGGLGRLAACYMDSMATEDVDAVGMGIRYRYGLFKQRIVGGWQEEEPDNWLIDGYPWAVRKIDDAVVIHFGGTVVRREEDGRKVYDKIGSTSIWAVPHDVPVTGFGGKSVNKLRLWTAQPFHESFDLAAFNRGDYSAAVRERSEAEAITNVLYPDDSSWAGKELRLKQEYFFSAAGVADILRTYKAKYGTDWEKFSRRVAIHINDTHPTLCIPELMRLLMDEEGLGWDEAWKIVTETVSYTNHTVMPEALEKWPIPLISRLLPRVYMIIEELDRRWRETFDRADPEQERILRSTAILWDGEAKMANLAVIASATVNGVSALHTEILKRDTLHDFYTLFPDRFRNVTNGVSHRRFVAAANPALGGLITRTVGNGWLRDASLLSGLESHMNDSVFLEDLEKVKLENKRRLASYIGRENHIPVDPNSLFDVQVKRIHAYKRQLLSIFKILALYDRLKEDPNANVPNTTFLLAGKAAAGYAFAKETIKLSCAVADMVNADPEMNGKMKVVFMENFSVSLGQLIYPAADLSEQISTAGKEASGTGCMKFMMNGAVTIGTLDGANVEILDLVGKDNLFLFGMTTEEVEALRASGTYNPAAEAAANPVLAKILRRLTDGSLGWNFGGVYDALTRYGDEFFVIRDFPDYLRAWEEAAAAHLDSERWNRMSLVNMARSGNFSSDRSIRDYKKRIWMTD